MKTRTHFPLRQVINVLARIRFSERVPLVQDAFETVVHPPAKPRRPRPRDVGGPGQGSPAGGVLRCLCNMERVTENEPHPRPAHDSARGARGPASTADQHYTRGGSATRRTGESFLFPVARPGR